MAQIKRDTLVLQGGGWVWDLKPHPIKMCSVEKLLKLKTRLRSTKDCKDRR
jgi:hypothetical protein